MPWLASTRARLLLAGLLTVGALLLVTASLLAMRSRNGVKPTTATASAGSGVALATPSRALDGVPATTIGSPRPAPAPTSTRKPPTTPTRSGTVAASPGATPAAGAAGAAGANAPASPVAGSSPLPAFTTPQLVADYNLVWNKLALIDPAAGLYAVAIVYEPGTVTTRFQFVSADKQWLYDYSVGGLPRASTERAGGPEVITPDAHFEPFTTLPWERDADWTAYVSRGLALLPGGGRASPAAVTQATLIARTGVAFDWDLAIEAPPQRAHYTITRGVLSQQTNVNPASPSLRSVLRVVVGDTAWTWQARAGLPEGWRGEPRLVAGSKGNRA